MRFLFVLRDRIPDEDFVMQPSVTLSQQTTIRNGRKYTYWVIRWFGSDGKRRGKQIGKTPEMSKRQAEKVRREKEAELQVNPGRRDVTRSPELGTFLEKYYNDRKTELAAGTLELHQQTGRYMVGYFGQHRRLDAISRADARAFRTALANGELAHINQRRRKKQSQNMAVTTVDQHMRHARKFFNHALDDDLVTFNPFDRVGQSSHVEKDWHYVDDVEFSKLMAAAKPAWKLLFALARWAGLRLEEALEMPTRKIDRTKRRLTVISRDASASEGGFTVKDKDSRVVPICPELFTLLEELRDPKSELVIPPGGVIFKNVWRDFQVLAKRAGVNAYSKPFHSLRKSCITDWASRFPAHVVKEWAGHQDIRTTLKYYLKVSESEYDKAAGLGASATGMNQAKADPDHAADLLTMPEQGQTAGSDRSVGNRGDGEVAADSFGASVENAEGPEPPILPFPGDLTGKVTGIADFEPSNRRKSKAGDGIRTHDVQLGKLAFYH
jgi:integrase